MDMKDLISGSDIRGTAIGEGQNLTKDTAADIASGFADFLKERKNGKNPLIIAVGHDSRITADILKTGVIDGLKRHGITVLDCGLVSTPSMYMMTQYKEVMADGAIMITASHHPFNKNGLKFFTEAGGLEHSDIEDIIVRAETKKELENINSFKVIKKDYLSFYCELIKDMIIKGVGKNMALEGLKIAVDAGNGAGGFYAERILMPLGADVSSSQFLELDGMFPNHTPNPEDKKAMQSISERVLKTGSDFGIIFDTDVDRAAVVDSRGREYNRNKLIALISAILLRESPNATIVTDSITSDGLTDFIKIAGGQHHRYKRGYRNVINEAVRLNAKDIYTPVAIETSGHCALMENYFLDDGAYLATRLLIELARLKKEGKTLDSLISGLKEPAEAAELRLGFLIEDFKNYGQKVIKNLFSDLSKDFKIAADNHEGIRANFDDGWLLVRMSVHDPIMPVNIESDKVGGVRCAAQVLYKILEKYDGLDISSLKNYINEIKL